MLKVVEKRAVDESEREVSALDRLARDGARRMLEQALEAEVDDYIERFRSLRDSGGRALVVRNGRARARTVVVGAGVLDVRAPRVNDKRVVEGERQKFTSEILPPYLRKSQSISELCPRFTFADCRRATSAVRSRRSLATALRAFRRASSLGS
jgi:glycine/D-amino acid oxidase-like deaminating enzyme